MVCVCVCVPSALVTHCTACKPCSHTLIYSAHVLRTHWSTYTTSSQLQEKMQCSMFTWPLYMPANILALYAMHPLKHPHHTQKIKPTCFLSVTHLWQSLLTHKMCTSSAHISSKVKLTFMPAPDHYSKPQATFILYFCLSVIYSYIYTHILPIHAHVLSHPPTLHILIHTHIINSLSLTHTSHT